MNTSLFFEYIESTKHEDTYETNSQNLRIHGTSIPNRNQTFSTVS